MRSIWIAAALSFPLAPLGAQRATEKPVGGAAPFDIR